MQEDTIKVFCLAHGGSFTTSRSNQVVICKEDIAEHVLSNNFPNSGRWFYCCQCQIYWVTSKGQGGFLRQCPACGLIKKARYYSCDQCNVTMMDSWGATNQRDIYVTPWGAPHPYCPGCYQLPKSIPQSHTCPELNGLLTTAHTECPFCEVEEKAEFGAGIAESKEIYPHSDLKGVISSMALPTGVERYNGMVDKEGARHEAERARAKSADETREGNATPPAPEWIRIEAGASDLLLEEIERRTAEIRALEAEAEAREAKAQERLRQAEIRLQLEMSLRSEAEQKSKDIEEELRHGLEVDGNLLEAVSTKFEAEADLKEELGMKAAITQAQSEAVPITSETITEIEAERTARLAAEQAKANAEARAHEAEARADQAEVRARQTEERRQSEVQEAVARAQAALLVSEEAQKKIFEVEEAIARAQEALLISEEAQKKIEEAEAGFREMTARACEAEERCRQAETGLQQEAAQRALAEERAENIENEFNRRLELAQAEFETGIAKARAEAQSSEESILRQLTQQAREEVEAATKDAHARIETEVKARRAAEQAKAEARKGEAKAKGTAENYKVEITKLKDRVQEVEATARQAEENYKVAIAGISAELEATAVATTQAEESHRAEIAKVSAEAEARAQQAEANAHQLYQTKVEEAIASAQAAMFTLEETQKKLIEAEAKYQEMEARARQAETRARQVYLISKLSSAFVEQVFGGALKMSDEKGGLIIPPDFAANAYLDKFSSEASESNMNGSMDYGDFSLPDKLKALFEDLAGAQVIDDDGAGNDNRMSLGPIS